MKEVATFYLQGINSIKGLGFLFSGYVLNDGKVNDGNFIEFKLSNNRIRRLIKRTVLVNIPSNYENGICGSIGLIIKCESKQEEESIKQLELKDVECLIFERQ